MADIDFPINPSLNAVYSFNGKTWIWDGSRWRTNNILLYTSGGTGFASYSTGDLLVGGGSALSRFNVGSSNSMYLKVDSTSSVGVTWFSPINNGLQYDVAYFRQAGNALTGTKGFFTYYDVSGFESVTVKSNYSFAFSVKNTSDNNKFIVDVQNGRTIFTGSDASHEIRVFNQNQSAYFGLKANATGTQTYILPPGAPSTGTSVLQSDTSGNLLWVPMVSGGISAAVTSINSQTGPSVTLQTGSSGTDFVISASTNTITFDIPSASASARGLVTTGSQTIAGTKTFSSSIVGNLSGYASTSTNSQVREGNEDSTHYVVFSPYGNSTSGVGLSTSNSATKLAYNPSTNVLTVGSVAGNLTGTATTSKNSYLAEATQSANHYVVFSLYPTSASGVALSTSNSTSKLAYNPNTNVLTVGSVSGNVTGNLTGTVLTSSQTNITSLGTITIGTWDATAISTAKGGTGLNLSASSGLIKFNSGTASEVNYPTAASIGLSYLTADSSGNVYWKDIAQVNNGQQYDIAYYRQAGTAVSGTRGFFTYFSGSGSESVTIKTNYSFAFSVKNTSDNNKFIVDVQNGRTVFTGNEASHEIRVYNQNESGYFGLKANATGTQTYILPPGAPSTGTSVLQSDISGNLLWVPMTSGGISNAITSINSQTGPSVTLQTGTSGTDFVISASTNTITFDIPSASASARGLVTTGSQTIAGSKTFSSSIIGNLSGYASTSYSALVNQTGNRDAYHSLLMTPEVISTGTAISSDSLLVYNSLQETLYTSGLAVTLVGTAVSYGQAPSLFAGGIGVSDNITALNKIGVGVSANNVTRSEMYASGTDIGFRIYESTNASPRVILGRNVVGSNQPGLAFANTSSTLASSGAVLGVQDASSTSSLAVWTSNGSSLQTRLLITGASSNVTTNTTILGGNISGTATTSLIRGVDATGTDVAAGEIAIQAGRSTGTGAVGGIRFSVASPAGSTGSGLNLGASIARITGTGVSINVVTASTSLITGSFVTLGGAGIGLSLNLGRGLNFWNDTTTNYVQFGFAGSSTTSYTLPSNTPLTGTGISVLVSTHDGLMRWVGLPVPGGSNLQIQYNNNGTLDGVAGLAKGATASDPVVTSTAQASTSTPLKLVGAASQSANLLTVSSNIADQATIDSAGNLSLRDKNELRLYNDADNKYSGFYFDGSSDALYKLPDAYPGLATSTLVCDSTGTMSWIRPKRSYVLSFGAGFTPTANAADSIQLNIPYAPDGTSLNYIIKRISYRNETTSGGTGLSFYLQRHTAGDAAWATANTITAGSGTSFLVGSGTYQTDFTTINSSSGTNGLVASGNYLRLYFTIVGTAANVSLSLLMEEQ